MSVSTLWTRVSVGLVSAVGNKLKIYNYPKHRRNPVHGRLSLSLLDAAATGQTIADKKNPSVFQHTLYKLSPFAIKHKLI